MNWRDIGDVSLGRWQMEIFKAGGPGALIVGESYIAAGEHTALCLAMLHMESSYATAFNRNIPENRNPLNLRPPNGTGYMAYSSWTEGIRSWRERITDPTYKQGIYARTKTLEELIHVYAPGSDNNNEAEYVKSITDDLARWGINQEEPMPITYGKVPMPNFLDHPLVKAENHGQNDLGQRSVKGVVWHRMIGSLLGTDGYFKMPSVNALTDYGVGVGGHDSAANDGVIIRWNNPLGRQSGWASGPVNGAYGDGLAFLNDNGGDLNVVNRDQASIEISGNYDTPLTEKSRQAIASLTAYWADQNKIPWNEFPAIPGKGYSFVRWHQEFTIGTGKVCPGAVVIAETPELIQRTSQIMKLYQTGSAIVPGETVYAKPAPIAWKKGDVGTFDQNGVSALAFLMEITCVSPTIPIDSSAAKAKQTGPKIKTGETRIAIGAYRGGPHRNAYLVLDDNSRVIRSKFRPLAPLPT